MGSQTGVIDSASTFDADEAVVCSVNDEPVLDEHLVGVGIWKRIEDFKTERWGPLTWRDKSLRSLGGDYCTVDGGLG